VMCITSKTEIQSVSAWGRGNEVTVLELEITDRFDSTTSITCRSVIQIFSSF